jgi:hypothetical protein
MKNIIFLTAVLLCVFLIIFGLIEKNKAIEINKEIVLEAESKVKTIPETEVLKKIDQLMTSSEATIKEQSDNNNQLPTVFYPDAVAQQTDEQAIDDGRNFYLSNELLVKLYLVDKYKPGICYGAPTAVPDISIDTVLSGQKSLADFLRQRYGLESELELYNKIKQINGIDLKEISSSNYNYSFMDGQCLILTYYQGRISVFSERIEEVLISRSVHDANDLKNKK